MLNSRAGMGNAYELHGYEKDQYKRPLHQQTNVSYLLLPATTLKKWKKYVGRNSNTNLQALNKEAARSVNAV